MSGRRRQAGQAQIELVAGVPLVVGVAAIILQLFAVGYSQSLADGATAAGAAAFAAGEQPRAAAEESLPGWALQRSDIRAHRGLVEVDLRPPSLIPGLGPALAVTSSAWARGG